jgi:hypothetical protein
LSPTATPTKAERHNNPLNIKQNGYNEGMPWLVNVRNCARNPWQGSLTIEFYRGMAVMMDETGHAVFKTLKDGCRAGLKLILNKYKSGLTSIHALIADPERGWAPASDTIGSIAGAPANPSNQYASFVAQACDFPAKADLCLVYPGGIDEAMAIQIARAIETFEAGKLWVPADTWQAAMVLLKS